MVLVCGILFTVAKLDADMGVMRRNQYIHMVSVSSFNSEMCSSIPKNFPWYERLCDVFAYSKHCARVLPRSVYYT
jgi:hypothetical protein